jgi:transposase-like protein
MEEAGMAPGPKPIAVVLSETEREILLGLLRRRSTSQDVALRARIVLACADPQATNTAIAKRLGISRRHGFVIYDALYAWATNRKEETHSWPPAGMSDRQ